MKIDREKMESVVEELNDIFSSYVEKFKPLERILLSQAIQNIENIFNALADKEYESNLWEEPEDGGPSKGDIMLTNGWD